MDEIITSVVAGLILTGAGSICGILWQQIRTYKTQHDQDKQENTTTLRLLSDGVRVLLLCKLESMQRTMVANHGVADNDEKASAQRIYDVYHALGGNGHGTQVNEDIQSAKIEDVPEEGR